MKVLSQKYLLDSDQSKRKTDVSTTTWSSLRKVSPLFQRGHRWSIHNGQSVNFWIDDWSGLGAVRTSISGTLNYDEFDHNFKTVRDLVEEQGRDCLSFSIPNAWWEAILSVLVSLNTEMAPAMDILVYLALMI